MAARSSALIAAMLRVRPSARYSSEVATTLLDVFARPLPCACQCHQVFSVEQRERSIAALFRFDDAMRGWGYEPIYDLAADGLYRAARMKNDVGYRGIAVRDDACSFRRLVGFAAHELIHALHGDVTKANYGIPFAAPYGVPIDVAPKEEAAFLAPFNRSEARAFLFATPFAAALWGIDYDVLTARDVGTYGFVGGNALSAVPPGNRPVAHWDRHHHTDVYYRLAQRLQNEEAGWFTAERTAELVARVEEAEKFGAAKRKAAWPSPARFADLAPRLPGRNDLCVCGSGKKAKKCCAGA